MVPNELGFALNLAYNLIYWLSNIMVLKMPKHKSSNSLVVVWTLVPSCLADLKHPADLKFSTFSISQKQGDPQVCRPRSGGPRTQSRTTDAILDCVENTFVILDPKLWRV